jgi:hypothetical protein
MTTATLAPQLPCEIVDFDVEGTEPVKLDTTFRCDRCPAQAYVLVTLTSGGQLTFCMHHANQHREALLPISSEWYSETSRLFNENKKKGSEN